MNGEKINEELQETLKSNDILDAPSVKSIRVVVEKLDNGYISNAEGKRKIYNEVKEIVKAIGMNGILDDIQENEYKINIDVVPKEEYENYADIITFSKQVKLEEKLTLEKAKQIGLIAREYNIPIDKVEQPKESDFEIKVTAENAYTIARLKSINFNSFDEQLPLSITEKANICGVNYATMHGLWKKTKEGKATFQLKSSRIAMTILSKYYEKNLNIRTSTKDQIEQLKKDVLKGLREMELLTDKNSFVKSSELSKKITEIRKLLIN